MDWIRENKSLAVIFGIITAACLALGYMLFDAYSKYTESKDAYLAMTSSMTAMQSAPLAPTQSNLAEKQALVAEFASTVNQLGAALVSLQPKVNPNIKNIEFQAKLKTKVADVRKAAGLSRLVLPADFAFGFDDYTSKLPSEAATPELDLYLDGVDEFVKLLMKCGVIAVDDLSRAKLPVEGTPAASQQNGRPGVGQQPQQNIGAISERRQITATLTLDQPALQLLLSRLSTTEMPHFSSLRLLRIENERQEGPLRDGSASADNSGGIAPPPPAPAAEGAPGAPAAPSNEIKPPEPAPVDSFPLIGQEKLKVRMEIDLIKFLPAASGAPVQAAPGMQQR